MKSLAALIVLCAVSGVSFSQPGTATLHRSGSIQAAGQGSPISYKLSFEPKTDRTNLVVDCSFKALAGQLELPQDFYGVPEIYKYAVAIQGLNGTVVKDGEKPNQKLFTPGKGGMTRIRYTMSYPGILEEDYSFCAVSKPNRFQGFLCQWMLRIGKLDEKRDYNIEVASVPKGWHIYTSLASTPRKLKVRSSYDDLISAMIGAGDVNRRSFKVKGNPVDVFLGKAFKLNPAEMLPMIERVVKEQRAWFGDYGQPFYTISIAERPDNVAGTCIENSFVCFVKPDVEKERLLMLLSHEMFHNWLPLKIHVDQPGETERWRWEWFDEGFTDYFARRLLLDAGIITPDRYVNLANAELLNIADNQARNITYTDLKKVLDAGEFTTVHKKLSYYRGGVIASLWDARLRQSSTTLAEVIKGLYKTAAATGGRITENQFYAVFSKVGIDAKAAQDSFIIRGEDIVPIMDPTLEGYEIALVDSPMYDYGFDFLATRRLKKITGLKAGSPAAQAGLEEGMEFVGTENSNRFGNAFDPSKPLTVIVKVGGAERRFSYRPEGVPRKVWQYRKAHQTTL